MNPPGFLFLHVASECNLACRHCLFWKSSTRHDPRRLSANSMSEIIGEFASLNPRGKVVICGGEPMLEYDRYIDVCQAARSRELRVFSATNGTPVHSARRAVDLLLQGPHEILVSLDSHLPEIHDEIRNQSGSYDAAIRAVKLLVQARREMELPGSRIHVMALLTKTTCGHLRELYHLVLHELRADKLKINALQPSFGVHPADPSDDFFASHSQIDVVKLKAELNACNSEFDLRLNPSWIDQLCNYYEDLQGGPDLHLGWNAHLQTRTHICNCYDRNLVVGLYGVIGHCYNFEDFPPDKYQQAGDLARFWQENNQRKAMRSCRRLCGIGHSNRALSATLKSHGD